MSKLPVKYVEEEDLFACPYCDAEVEKWETECWNCKKPFAPLEEDEDWEEDEEEWEEAPAPKKKRPEQKNGQRKAQGGRNGGRNASPKGKPKQGNLRTKSKENERGAAGKKQAARGQSRGRRVVEKEQPAKGSVLNILTYVVVFAMVIAVAFAGFKIWQSKNAASNLTSTVSEYGAQVDDTQLNQDVQGESVNLQQ